MRLKERIEQAAVANATEDMLKGKTTLEYDSLVNWHRQNYMALYKYRRDLKECGFDIVKDYWTCHWMVHHWEKND